MLFKSLATAALLATATAYQVLTPTSNTTVTKGSTIDIKWSSVDTDADIFSVYLTNFQTVHWPPTVVSLAQNVPKGLGSIKLRIPCDVTSDYGWQINFINGTNTYVIYAQSAVFSLTGSCIEPTTTASKPVPTGYTNTTTVHVTDTVQLCTTVSRVVYATPVVWFVEPSKEAVCGLPAKETVTVYKDGPAPVTCGGSKPTSAPTYKPTSNATVTPTGTGSIKPTSPPQFTGAATSVKASGAVAVLIGAVAFLL